MGKPEPFIFERVLAGRFFSKTSDREAVYSNHRMEPILAAGYAELKAATDHKYENKPSDNWTEIIYRPTPAGLLWWATERANDQDVVGTRYDYPVESLLPCIEGKGIGSTIEISPNYRQATFKAIRDGLIEFASYSGTPPYAPRCFESITGTLTEKGYRFYSAIPKFVEVY